MPNGGSDCCGTCWFNRSNGGESGSHNFNSAIPSFCEIRGLPISDPFYTYCANHPYRLRNRDPVPIGPVYVHRYIEESGGFGSGVREFWKASPDTEEIRQHLLELVRTPEKHKDGYPYFSSSPHITAIEQLVDWGDQRVIEALEDLAQRDEVEQARPDILELINTVRERLGT